jgi:hypothetical protein
VSSRRKSPYSLEQRVWRWCRSRGELTSNEVAKGMRIGYWSTVQTLMRLCSKGCMERRGRPAPKHRRYAATDLAPQDGRGLMAGSLEALRHGYKKPRAEIPNPKPTIALEECWGFLPVSRVADNEDANENAA